MPLPEKFTQTFSAVQLTAVHDENARLGSRSNLSFQLLFYEKLIFNFAGALCDRREADLATYYAQCLCKNSSLSANLISYVKQSSSFFNALASQQALSPETAGDLLRDLLHQRRLLQVAHPTLFFPLSVQLNGSPIPLDTPTPEELSALWLAQTAHNSLYECKKGFLADVLTHAKNLPHTELIDYLARAANTPLARYQTTKRYLGCLWPWRSQTQQFLYQLILRCSKRMKCYSTQNPLAKALKKLRYRQACFHIQANSSFYLSDGFSARDVVILR